MLSTCKVSTYSAFYLLGKGLLLRAILALSVVSRGRWTQKLGLVPEWQPGLHGNFGLLCSSLAGAFIRRMAQFSVLILHRIDWWLSHVGPDLAINLFDGPCFGNAPTLGLYLTLKVLPREDGIVHERFSYLEEPYTKGASSSEIAN